MRDVIASAREICANQQEVRVTFPILLLRFSFGNSQITRANMKALLDVAQGQPKGSKW